MKKGVKLFYFAIFISIIFSIIFSVSAVVNKNGAWESIGDLRIGVNGQTKIITDANVLVKDTLSPSTISSGTAPLSGHNADEVWVSISGQEMTLKDALATVGLCGLNNPKTTYTNKPTTPQYHFATEIEFSTSPEASLQDAINSGAVLYTKNNLAGCNNHNLYYYDSCNRLGNLKEDCSIVQACTSYGNWYCTPGTNVQAQRDRTCYVGSCSGTSCIDNPNTNSETKSCPASSNLICSGGDCAQRCLSGWTLSGDDCYSPESNDNNCEGDSCTSAGNENRDQYICASGEQKTCSDTYYYGSIPNNCKKRTIYCYSS